MKTAAFLLVIILGSLTTVSIVQVSKVWAQINDNAAIPTRATNGQLSSTDNALNSTIAAISITNISQALPDSKQEKLQRVYEIECACAEDVLMNSLKYQDAEYVIEI